jgi:hypothetical protein
MRKTWFLTVALLGLLEIPVPANELTNSDLSNGLEGWHGDGFIVFLNPEGSEGQEGDGTATPVIKIHLTNEPHFVCQELRTINSSNILTVKVDIMPSSDFKRSNIDDDYNRSWWGVDGTWYQHGGPLAIPAVDFWIRCSNGGREWAYKLANTTAGQWTTVIGKFKGMSPIEGREIYFCVPIGKGSIYLKNFSVEP